MCGLCSPGPGIRVFQRCAAALGSQALFRPVDVLFDALHERLLESDGATHQHRGARRD